jgi:hypothetical protein
LPMLPQLGLGKGQVRAGQSRHEAARSISVA